MRILAIDIGSANIKTVILETKFKRFDIVLHDVSPVADALLEFTPGEFVLSSGQVSALAAIQQKYGHSIDHVVTNLPFSLYSSRIMSFPFRDKKKVHAAVQFAIEDEIPFNIEDCVLTSHLYPGKGKESHVLTGFSPIESLRKFIDALDSAHLPVNVFTMDQAALASALARDRGTPAETFAVLNLGHRKSSIYLFKNGVPVLHRTTMIGGYHVTKAIADKYEISMAEAELAKIDRAFLPHPTLKVSEDQRVFSSLIQKTLDPVFGDVQQAFMAFASRFNEDIASVSIIGGTSLIPGITQNLGDRWNKQIRHYEFTHHFPNLSIHPQKNSEIMLPIASSLALSQLSGETKTQINFRTGKLKISGKSLNLNLQQFIYPAKLALAVYLFAFFSLTGQMFALKASLVKKDTQFEQAIQGVLGHVPASQLSSLKASPSKLKQTIDKKVEELATQFNGGSETNFSSLDLILALSQAVPRNATMEIKQMELTPSSISMQVESPGEAQANAAIGALTHLPFFLGAKASPIEAAKGTRKKFSLNAGVSLKKEPN